MLTRGVRSVQQQQQQQQPQQPQCLPPPKEEGGPLTTEASVIKASATLVGRSVASEASESWIARLGLEPWAAQLAEQELDLQAMALVEAQDLNRQLHIPLGRAAKAIHAARQLLEDNISYTNASGMDDLAATSRSRNSSATLMRSSWNVRLHANLPMAALVKSVWDLRRAFGFLDLFFFFVDHQVRWVRSLGAHRDGGSVKEGTINVGLNWTTNMSLWLGVVTSLMGAEHQGAPPWMRLAYEALLSLDAVVLLTCLMAKVVVTVCLYCVHDSQVHNFLAAAEAPLQICEFLLLVSVHMTILSVVCKGLLHLFYTDWGDLSESLRLRVATTVAALSLVVILLCAAAAFVMSNLVYHGGLMAAGDIHLARANRGAASAAVWQRVREKWS